MVRLWLIRMLVLAVLGTALMPWTTVRAQGVPSALPAIDLSEDERKWLDAHRGLRLGMWLGAPPIMFRGRDGGMQGMVPAYVDLILRKLELAPRRVLASGYAPMVELARAGEVDVVAAVSSQPELAEDLLLSAPFLYMPVVIVTRLDYPFISGIKDFTGRVVAVETGLVPHQRIPEEYPGVRILPVDSPDQGLLSVAEGRADAYVGDEPTVAYLSNKHRITDVRVAAITEYSYRFSIGVRKDWPVLLTLINRALTSISEEERKGIRDYWTVLKDSQWVERPQVWRIVGGVLLVALGVFGIFAFWNIKLGREVRRRKGVEERLRRAHEATRQVIESADVIILGMDYTGHVRLFNNAGQAITGYSLDEVMGKDWFDLVVPRERFPYVWDEFVRLLREGSKQVTEAFENPIITKSGETRHILWRNTVLENADDDMAIISFGTDITSRLKAEEELRLTQFAMDNAAVGVFRIRPSGRIVYANRTAAVMLGYPRGQLKRLNVVDISRDFDRDTWPDFWLKLKRNQMITTEKTATTRDGKVIPLEVTAHYLLFKGTELAIGFFFDISERKRVESLREDVERMVRHDLRSPTLAVQTLFKLFGDADNLTEDQRDLLGSLNASSRRMLNIIDMSRALYRMETGEYVPDLANVDLVRLAREVLTDLRPLARLKKLTMDVRTGGEPASEANVFIVRSEELLCYAMLTNLIKNAMEASPDSGIVTLDFHTDGEHRISVRNSGVIPESIRDTFFDKYVTSGKAHGTGLGTYTAQLVARSLGGSIGFTSSQKDGTTITVVLPK